MRAWQMTDVGRPLELREVPDPVAGAGEVIIRLQASGLCHSDVGFVDGTLAPLLPFLPITLGHEIVGTIESLGSGVQGFAVGDRVGVPADIDTPGTASDGGFADLVAARSELLVPIPDEVPFDQAATASCAGRTAYHALASVGEVRPGMKVGIIGLGGLGALGAQIGLALGATVYAAEINESLHDRFRALGLAGVSTDIRDFRDEQLDLIVDFAGFGTATTGAALEAVRNRGRVVVVGLAVARGEIDINDLVLRSLELVGSQGGTKEDYVDILELMRSGTVSSVIEHIGFEQIGDGIERLERGGLVARLVVDLAER
ncbi:MAG: alcohol dehydrogenase, propanol-preferring [Subtercola sp.]|nr:alcohol dehydrogenase, propanol-preferring [Subtercola sp.]